MGGRFYQVEPWGDGLRLDSGRSATGVYCMAAVDSGENGFRWGGGAAGWGGGGGGGAPAPPPPPAGRPPPPAPAPRLWGAGADLAGGIQSLEGDPMPALGKIFGPPVAESGDGLIGRSGRYLWLMLELTAFVVLGTHISKTYARISNPHDLIHINRSHNAELLKHFRLAVHIGSAIYQHEKALFFGDNR